MGKLTTDRNGWIGVDLDGTLAEYHGYEGPLHIGPSVPRMVRRVKQWLADGWQVRVVTARVAPANGDVSEVYQAITLWLRKHVGVPLPITNEKDYGMLEIWDDRAVQVIPNTGFRADGADEDEDEEAEAAEEEKVRVSRRPKGDASSPVPNA